MHSQIQPRPTICQRPNNHEYGKCALTYQHSKKDCNRESVFDKIPSFSACSECDRPFLKQNSEERFGDYLYCTIGYMGTVLDAAQSYHNFDLCSDCNIKHFDSIRDEFEDEISDPERFD